MIGFRSSVLLQQGELAAENDKMRLLIQRLTRHQFGRRSEQLTPDQLQLALEELEQTIAANQAGHTREFARDIGLEPRTTPLESPQSNGMAEAFVRTFKRDYARVNAVPNAHTVLSKLPSWFDHYNRIHPHKALSYRSPIEFISAYVAT